MIFPQVAAIKYPLKYSFLKRAESEKDTSPAQQHKLFEKI